MLSFIALLPKPSPMFDYFHKYFPFLDLSSIHPALSHIRPLMAHHHPIFILKCDD
jgi:hypothetical protein